jgi:hypothetical protein
MSLNTLIRYGKRSNLSQSEIDDVIAVSRQHGEVTIYEWDVRSGAIDLVYVIGNGFRVFNN